MILRIAHFRVPPDRADELARSVRAMLGRVRRMEGLSWSAVGSQPDGDNVRVIAVSLWRDRDAMAVALGTDPEGRSQAETSEGLPPATLVELADVVDGMGLPAGPTTADAPLGRRRHRLLPQDRQLLRLLCSGVTLAQAAATLGVSVGTAKNRRHEIYEKLGVHDLSRACTLAAPELEPDGAAIAS